MFKNVILEYEQKNNYFSSKFPDTEMEIRNDLQYLFPEIPSQVSIVGLREMDELFKTIMEEITPGIWSKINDKKAWKKFFYTSLSRFNKKAFKDMINKLDIGPSNKMPDATEWETVIAKRGNLEFAEGFNYQAQIIGYKIAMNIRNETNDFSNRFEMMSKKPLNPYWSKLLINLEKADDTTKTDVKLGDHLISLKKKGGSQIFSGGKGETYAVLTYALNKYIEDDGEKIIKQIDELTKKFEHNQDFNKFNNFSAYLLATFDWSDKVKKFVEMNKESFKQDINNKATIILKTMAIDYYKTLKKTKPELDDKEFKTAFINNIQKIWKDGLNNMKVIEDIASNTDMPTDDEIFKVEEILTSVAKNYRGDSVKGRDQINIDSLKLIKTKLGMDQKNKTEEYIKFVNAKKQFKISTDILNDIFQDNPMVKRHMIYEAITGDFKFNKNEGAANKLCVFDAETGKITYNHVDMAFVESIENKFDIVYSFKSDKKLESLSRAALRMYYKEDFELLSFHMIDEGFVQFLKNKYNSFGRALVKTLLMKIKKIFKKAFNPIKLLNKLFRSKISKESIKVTEDYI